MPAAAALVVGHVIAVGIFLTPGTIIRTLASPVAVFAIWTGMGAMAICGSLCYGALAGTVPADRRQLRLPARNLRIARRVSLRLDVPPDHGPRDHGSAGHRVRQLPCRADAARKWRVSVDRDRRDCRLRAGPHHWGQARGASAERRVAVEDRVDRRLDGWRVPQPSRLVVAFRTVAGASARRTRRSREQSLVRSSRRSFPSVAGGRSPASPEKCAIRRGLCHGRSVSVLPP